uniref:Uncharacterized protein n=1 Tax=Panagrellus redivivus TaxID=6233 RepID=A0A7E4UQY9_PANRE
MFDLTPSIAPRVTRATTVNVGRLVGLEREVCFFFVDVVPVKGAAGWLAALSILFICSCAKKSSLLAAQNVYAIASFQLV